MARPLNAFHWLPPRMPAVGIAPGCGLCGQPDRLGTADGCQRLRCFVGEVHPVVAAAAPRPKPDLSRVP